MRSIYDWIRLPSLAIAAAAVLFASTAAAAPIHPDLSGDELAEKLREEYSPSRSLSYREAREEMFSFIDSKMESGQRGVVLVYTGTFFATTAIPNHQVVNTEHTWPQSKFSGPGMKSDIHHLFPTISQVNSERGNKPFAEIPDHETLRWWNSASAQRTAPAAGDRDEYSEAKNSTFEPREAHKGDVARAMFYFLTIYGDEDIDRGWFKPQLPTLLTWHAQFPADADDVERSRRVQQVQGNENPFVLDETLAFRIFGQTPPPADGLDATALAAFRRFSTVPVRTGVEDAAALEAEEERPIRIVTWNVREIFTLGDVRSRRRRFREFAEDVRPDILLVQEFTSFSQLRRIRDADGPGRLRDRCVRLRPE